jgi:hypothetical protein
MIKPEAGRLFFAVTLGALIANHQPPHFVAQYISDDDWRDTAKTSDKFTSLLLQKFPQGTEESLLTSELLAAGFKPVETQGRAHCEPPIQVEPLGWVSVTCNYPAKAFEYHWSTALACGAGLYVNWSTDDSIKIARIKRSVLNRSPTRIWWAPVRADRVVARGKNVLRNF